jgi:hypothetical protein
MGAAGPLMARYLAVFLASGHEAPAENAGSWLLAVSAVLAVS